MSTVFYPCHLTGQTSRTMEFRVYFPLYLVQNKNVNTISLGSTKAEEESEARSQASATNGFKPVSEQEPVTYFQDNGQLDIYLLIKQKQLSFDILN